MNKISSSDIDKILAATRKPGKVDYCKLKSILDLCPKVVCKSFSLEVLRDIEPLLKDPRSKAVIPALEESIRTGKEIPTYIVDAVNAYADAASASANAAAAAAADAADADADAAAYADAAYAYAAYAAAAAADAAYASAASAAYAAAANDAAREEKYNQYFSILKATILKHTPEDSRWQTELLI